MMICPRCMRQFDDDVQECPDDGTRLREFRDSSSQILGVALDGRWLIEEKIGEGGMGEVYRARQVNVDRVVAVKILRLALASTEQYVARFFREADIATSVKHPHFVTIYDFGQTSGQLLYIAMELLDGEPLSAILRRRRLDLLETLTIAAQVCAALAAAHEARIVHRDLKPDNIFLINVAEGETFVKVLDFGIAKDLDSENQVTKTGQLFGTPEYMSPEQCEGAGRVDGRSDLYALGCILYEALTSRSPYQRDSIIQTLLAQVSDEPKSFAELGIPAPAGVEAIVFKLLEKHPDNRYGSAIQARDALLAEIDRLRTHSGEIHVYETVSANIPPRDHTAQTVSYSDLAHPLQLEGILASSAKGDIASSAKKRRESDAEKSTENVALVNDDRSSNRMAVLAIVTCLVILGGFFALRGSSAAPATAVPRADPARAAAQVQDAVDAALHQTTVTAVEGDARRQALAVALAAGSVAVSPDEKAVAPLHPKKAPKKLDINIGIRTQASMKSRLLGEQRALLECYNRREQTADGGDVKFVFEIEADGSLRSARVTSTELRSQTVLTCMKDVASRLTFLPAAAAARFEKILTFKAAP